MNNKKYQVSLVVFFVMVFSLLLFYQNCSKSSSGNLGGTPGVNNVGPGNGGSGNLGIVVQNQNGTMNATSVTINGVTYPEYTFTWSTDLFNLIFANAPQSAVACLTYTTSSNPSPCYPYPFSAQNPPGADSTLSTNTEYTYNSSLLTYSFNGWGGNGDRALKDSGYIPQPGSTVNGSPWTNNTYQLCVYDPNNYTANKYCVILVMQ